MSSEGTSKPIGLGTWALVAILAVILAWVFSSFFFRAFSVVSRSMSPTLLVGDFVLVNKLAYRKGDSGGSNPQPGDIVVFSRIVEVDGIARTRNFIKRIKGVPGDSGLELGKYYLLGDNPDASVDSRVFGAIDFTDIEGRVEFIYWSWEPDKAPFGIRWARIGKRL